MTAPLIENRGELFSGRPAAPSRAQTGVSVVHEHVEGDLPDGPPRAPSAEACATRQARAKAGEWWVLPMVHRKTLRSRGLIGRGHVLQWPMRA